MYGFLEIHIDQFFIQPFMMYLEKLEHACDNRSEGNFLFIQLKLSFNFINGQQ